MIPLESFAPFGLMGKTNEEFASGYDRLELPLQKSVGYAIDDIASLIWPTWSVKARQWSTPSGSATRIRKLMKDDLVATEALTRKFNHRAKGYLSEQGETLSQAELLELELNSIANSAGFLEGLSPPNVERICLTPPAGVSTISFYMKSRFQRPRPNTVFYMAKKPLDFVVSDYPVHPSLISGHAFYAMMQLLDAYSRANGIDSTSRAAFLLHAVAPADRRVMAGLHFVSDNFGSWIAAAHLIPHFWPSESKMLKQFAWKAITTKSLSYAEVRTSDAFAPVREKLEAVLT
jgi:hypothetical protein